MEAFDLAFREYETGRIGVFQYAPGMSGTCGAVAGPAGSLARFGSTSAAVHQYIQQHGMRGVVALVHPAPQGSSAVEGKRLAGAPVFQLNATNKSHWEWRAVPDSEAAEGDTVVGGLHQVAMYSSDVTRAPSDPTIEQFNPEQGAVSLYLIERYP